MRMQKRFDEFLNYDRRYDYGYNIEHVHTTIGAHDKKYYEIFITDLNEFEDDEKDFLIVERFCRFLDRCNDDYDTEDVFNDVVEYVSVYDATEYIGDAENE